MEKALAAFGLVAEAPLDLDEEFHLWPENEEVFWLWMACQTQWFYSEGRRRGLQYSGVMVVMEAHQIPRKKRNQYFCLVQAMEQTCLNVWAHER